MQELPFCGTLRIRKSDATGAFLGISARRLDLPAVAEGYKFPASDACFPGLRVVANGAVTNFVLRTLMDPDVGPSRVDKQPPPTPNRLLQQESCLPASRQFRWSPAGVKGAITGVPPLRQPTNE